MPLFANRDALRGSLHTADLDDLADAIVASSLDCISFIRAQAPIAETVPGASRMGGPPAMPAGFEWPVRPPMPDAKERAAEMDRSFEITLKAFSGDPFDGMSQDLLDMMGAEAVAEARAAMANMDTGPMVAEHELQKEVLFTPMPLAFVGQVNLDELADLPALDPLLPRTGLLSFFMDASVWDGGTRMVHVTEPANQLELQPAPEALATYHDRRWPDLGPFAGLEKCELLMAHAAVSVPYSWSDERVSGTHADAINEWQWEGEGQFALETTSETVALFGDVLGGWPNPIQDSPEYDFMPLPPAGTRYPPLTPGESAVRQVFSHSAEFFNGTQMVPTGGDGQYYWMGEKADIRAQNWTALRAIYQQT